MTTAADIFRPWCLTFVGSSIRSVNVLDVDRQTCAIDCQAVIEQLNSYWWREESKCFAMNVLENPSTSPHEPTVEHQAAHVNTAPFWHEL